MIETILKACREIKNDRHSYSILASITEEVGELGKEVAISNRDSYKTPDADGIIGESIDIILSAVDMIYIEKPDVTEEELLPIVVKKLEKWKQKVREHMEEKLEIQRLSD